LEYAVLAYLLEMIGSLFERAESGRRAAYLATSPDLGGVARRMRAIERWRLSELSAFPNCLRAWRSKKQAGTFKPKT
jgi:hypothetical protein